ncbi:MAG: Bifunctional protein HldE [bacterium]|nr:Bifunctional protein HldE [bacterium]
MNTNRLREILEKLPSLRIGVLGDFCLDRYFDIEPTLEEISRETGRPCHQVFRVRCSPGGAGNVSWNVADLGVGTVCALGPTGDDGEGYALREALRRVRVSLDHLIAHPTYLTPTYNKPLVIYPDAEPVELDRIDIRTRGRIDTDLEDRLLAALEETFPTLNGLLVADQFEERNHHAVTDRIRARVIELAGKHPEKIVFADSRARTGEFRNVFLKPNAAEAALALGVSGAPETLPDIAGMGKRLAEQCGKPAYITLGEKGVLLCEPGEAAAHHIPGFPAPPPVDICGAGDTTIAAMASALCAGATLVEAGILGCLAASISVQKIGITGTANPEELLKRLAEYQAAGYSVSQVT